MKIGVIDSGIGGLTVLSSLINKCPKHEYIYFGDTFNLPYGDKTKEQIINLANNIVKFLEQKKVDLIVVACGTISSNIEYVKSNVEVIDIISPLKNKLDKYKKISVMATPLSIKTNAFKKYIKSKLNLISCPKLVPIIENNRYKELDEALKEYMRSTFDSNALILGCTHYPIIKEYIKKYFVGDIIYLDEYVVDLIKKYEDTKYSLKLYFSKVDDKLIKNTKKILNINDLDIKEIKIC